MARIIDREAMNMVGDQVRKYRFKRKMSQQMLSSTYSKKTCRGQVFLMKYQILATPVRFAASATAFATAGPTRLSKAAGMM